MAMTDQEIRYYIKSCISLLSTIGNTEMSEEYRHRETRSKILGYFESPNSKVVNHISDGDKSVKVYDYLSNIIMYYTEDALGIKYTCDMDGLQVSMPEYGRDSRSYQDITVTVGHKGFYLDKKELERGSNRWKFTFVYVRDKGWKIYGISKGGLPPAPKYITLCRKEKNGKKGFIDRSVREVIPLVYDHARDFSEGRAWVGKDGESFYIDKNGNKVGD